ncbi:hypothetical protein ABW19_dt0200723 [Dactylella cylindrospora]|nr:hypothetical protein ABW19_dt0200723 [Dactylella cylindrospora]
MSEVRPIEEVVGPDAIKWITTNEERESIAQALDIDASLFAHRDGNVMAQHREQCSCGKYSGLDDLVHDALKLGVHSKQFMADVLVNGPSGPSPAHGLNCSKCGNMFTSVFHWFPGLSQPQW